jgi:bifunctional DNA-binding transcriptional regulator/antitoxin component of YhaV-PrlF toxin-antitoxin module
MEIRLQMGKGGRLVVPVKLRRALNIQAGDEFVARIENNSIRLIPLQQAVILAQQAVRKYVPEGVSLVDELIKARREEARNE